MIIFGAVGTHAIFAKNLTFTFTVDKTVVDKYGADCNYGFVTSYKVPKVNSNHEKAVTLSPSSPQSVQISDKAEYFFLKGNNIQVMCPTKIINLAAVCRISNPDSDYDITIVEQKNSNRLKCQFVQ